ncbi:hypothetical protein BDV95DRAFT_554523 [Massariosphaeria phaeospora]|uniref:Piwi domain-containing protein n=1 Tax=Massariosphaeria phaeospora TaxID=100035 RepID=A0A7C8M054_9PLEO|nr:hypothetical protein BDV95DRAFT_554523 [Massariosphaeria phaeospora]
MSELAAPFRSRIHASLNATQSCGRCGKSHSLVTCTSSPPYDGPIWNLIPEPQRNAADEYLRSLQGSDQHTATSPSSAPQPRQDTSRNTGVGQHAVGKSSTQPSSSHVGSAQQQPATTRVAPSSPVLEVDLVDAQPVDLSPMADSPRDLDSPSPAHNGHASSHPDNTTQIERFGKEGKSRYPGRNEFRNNPHQVVTNHFRVSFDPKATFYEYQVSGIPDSEPRKTKRRYMETVIRTVPFLRDNHAFFATDNIQTIVSWKNLHALAPGEKTNVGNVLDEGSEWRLLSVRDTNGNIIELRLQLLRIVDILGLDDYANARIDPLSYDPNPVVNALNIVITKCLHSATNNIFHLNSHKFFIKDAFRDLPMGQNTSILRAIRGCSYTIKPGMGSILLNVNAVTSVFWKNNPVSMVLKNLAVFRNDRRALIGVQVYINYERGTKTTQSSGVNAPQSRIKTIRGFGKPCNQQTFQLSRTNAQNQVVTTNPTVEAYQKQAYNRTLQSPGLAAVNLGGKHGNESWFAPEDLTILPYQIWNKVVPETVAQNFHSFSCRGPRLNRQRVENEGLAYLLTNNNPSQMDRCPPLRFARTMLEIPAARLQYPPILYRNHAYPATADYGTGRWNLANKSFYTQGCAREVRWTLLVARGLVNSDNTIYTYTAEFNNQLRQCGVCPSSSRMGQPVFMANVSETEIRRHLTNIVKPRGGPDIVVLLLPRKDQDAYSTFKYLADKVFFVQAICLTEEKNLRNRGPQPLRQYMANVAMKANLKMAGINHSAAGLDDVLKDTFVIGADITHPGSGAIEGCPSIAAVVGSVDETGGKFLGSLGLQDNIDMVQYFESMVHSRLLDYCTRLRKFPTKVLYYRDGVSESQYDEVIRTELPAIGAAFESVFHHLKRVFPPERLAHITEVPAFKLTAVVVGKRHHTRFYPTKPADAMKGNENCRPGTLVDNTVTSPYYGDFYLQSHNGIKGTARPAHYFVLRNEIVGMTTAKLQELTHKLCHTYVRATLGVSYASPAYYADRLCERGRCYLRRWYSPDPPTRDQFDNRKRDIVNDLKKENHTGSEAGRAKQRGKKTDAEREAEKNAEKEMDDKIRARMAMPLKEEINRRWKPEVDESVFTAEWRTGLHRTMYWM